MDRPLHWLAVPMLTSWALALSCASIVRDPSFVGSRDQVSYTSLIGPFDGQVLDEATLEPLPGAIVTAIWSYDQGEGLIGPGGSTVSRFQTDPAGRYKIPEAPPHPLAGVSRLVAFELIVHKRGYVGYRSDVSALGEPREDFAQRHNRVLLRKWRESDSHAEQLLMLTPPPRLALATRWERDAANLDLYRAQSGDASVLDDVPGASLPPEGGPAQAPDESGDDTLLDARALLDGDAVRVRTSYAGEFSVRELGDLARTSFYQGVHLQAVDRDESWDLGYRVWQHPPAGLDSVRETFEATLPGVAVTGDITDETWIYDATDVRAVAFVDEERDVGVLLTCGASQCVDIETAILLARYIHDGLDTRLTSEAAPEAAP